MSHFIFKARKPNGEIYKGERDAADRFELYRLIRETGEEVVEFKEKAAGGGWSLNMDIAALSRIKTTDKINFARNLGSMLEAGLSLMRALSVLERQSKNKALKKVLTDLMDHVNKGATFAEAVGKYPKIFPPIFPAMIKAGEQSGTLSEALKALASQTESVHNLERRVRGAMAYPTVILLVMAVIAVLMLMFVVPTLSKVFSDLGVSLPLPTRIVLGLSGVVLNDGPWVLLGAAIAVAVIWQWFRKPSGKRAVDFFLLKIPIVGTLVQEVNTARTARTLSSLLLSGVEVVQSVSIAAAIVQNVQFRAVLAQAQEVIKKGGLMSKAFEAESKLYPTFFSEMLSVGEETGRIGEMLGNVASYYESDVDQKTKDMSTVIEPVLMVVIGAAVGFFAISMIQPIYSLVNVIH